VAEGYISLLLLQQYVELRWLFLETLVYTSQLSGFEPLGHEQQNRSLLAPDRLFASTHIERVSVYDDRSKMVLGFCEQIVIVQRRDSASFCWSARKQNWLPVLRTQRNIARGWLVVPVYRNFCDRNVIYTVAPPNEQDKPEPVNLIMLVLAFRKMLDEGTVNNQSHLAQQVGLTRARVTQLFNLLKLPPAIVAELSAAKDPAQIVFYTERRLRPVTKLASTREQLIAFRNVSEEFLALQ